MKRCRRYVERDRIMDIALNSIYCMMIMSNESEDEVDKVYTLTPEKYSLPNSRQSFEDRSEAKTDVRKTPVWQRSVAGMQSRLFLCPLSASVIGENQLIICLFVLFHFLTFIEQPDSGKSSLGRWISLLEPRGVSRPLKWASISSLFVE